MAASPPAKIHKLILDIKDCVQELNNEFLASGAPIDEDSATLHSFCIKLEHLLLTGLKEKYSLLGNRKSYWEYFCKCLASRRGVHDGLIFVKSVSEFKTSLGRGRAFIRYCLVHQCLADTLQQCFQNDVVTRDYYVRDSLQQQDDQSSYLTTALYDLNGIQFDLSSHGHDLDVSWPTFARKVFGSPSHWRAPSRTTSLTSLTSVFSQQTDASSVMITSFGEVDQMSASRSRGDSANDCALQMDDINQRHIDVRETREKPELKLQEIPSMNVANEDSSPEAQCPEERFEAGVQVVEGESSSIVDSGNVDVGAAHERVNEVENAETTQQLSVVDPLSSQDNNFKEIKEDVQEQLISENRSECDEQLRQEISNDVSDPSLSRTAANEDNGRDLLLVEIKTLQEENVLLKDRCDKWKKVMNCFNEKLAIKEKVNGHLERQVNALKESVAALKDIMQIKTAEANSLKTMVEDLKALRNADVNSNSTEDQIRTLELENANLKEELANLNVNLENLKRVLSSKLALLEEQARTLTNLEARHSDVDATKDQVLQLTKQLEASQLENQRLSFRLEKMQEILGRVEKAEEELEKLEAAEEASLPSTSTAGSDERDGHDDEDNMDQNETTVNFVLCEQSTVNPEDLLVFTVVNRTVGRLKRLISEKNDLQLQLRSSNEINSTLITKVQEQQEKLSTVTLELSEAKSLVEQLKKSHRKLQTAEAIVKYELKEKRSVVEKMKQMLESSRTQWMRIRQKHAESEVEWHSLRADFANRVKQESLESGFVEDTATERSDERESSVVQDDGVEKRLQSPTNSDLPALSPDCDDLESSSLQATSPPANCDLEDLPESPREDDDEDLSSSESERRRNTRARLRIMEEQCQQLYSRLVASVRKSEFLEWKLSELHEHHGPNVDNTAKNDAPESHVKDVNANFDVLFVPYSPDMEAGPATIPEDDLLGSQDSVVEGDNDTFPTEGETSDSLSCDADGSRSQDTEAIDQLSQSSAVDVDLIPDVDSTLQPLGKPPPLMVAQALPKRIVLLRKRKEDLEENMKKMEEEKIISDAREAELLSQLEAMKTLIADKDSCLQSLIAEKSATIQRETEFKKRAEFIMRKEREEKEATFQALARNKLELENRVGCLEDLIEEREAVISRLENSLLKSEDELNSSKTMWEGEVASLRFQLSSETLKNEIAHKSYAYHKDQISSMQDQISKQEKSIMDLEKDMDAIRLDRDNEKERHRSELEELKMCLTTREEECAALNDDLKLITRQYDDEVNKCSKLEQMCKTVKTSNIKLKEELEELSGDMSELKKNMIKLTREKDLLWKRSERLSYIQKIQLSDRWLKDEEVTNCLACKQEFSLILRKHHCRLCGRIFCAECCNHWVMTTSSSRKVRVCSECILSHSVIEPESVEIDSEDDDPGNTRGVSLAISSTLQMTVNGNAITDTPEDAATSSPILLGGTGVDEAEKVTSHQCGSQSLSLGNSSQEERSMSNSLLGKLFSSWSLSPRSKVIPDEDEEFYVLSDEEIIRSLSHSSPYAPLDGESADPSVHISTTRHINDLIQEFSNDMPREFWVTAGKIYVLPTLITDRTAITWEFTTEPKSIAFSLVFRSTEDEEVPEDTNLDASCFLPPTEVLIPVTHCDSHLHPIRGKLVAKKRGIYSFYFDNGFSKFKAKKVKFIMHAVNAPKDTEKVKADHCPAASSPSADSLETT